MMASFMAVATRAMLTQRKNVHTEYPSAIAVPAVVIVDSGKNHSRPMGNSVPASLTKQIS